MRGVFGKYSRLLFVVAAVPRITARAVDVSQPGLPRGITDALTLLVPGL